MLARCKLPEVPCSLGHNVVVQLENYAPRTLGVDSNVELHIRLFRRFPNGIFLFL